MKEQNDYILIEQRRYEAERKERLDMWEREQVSRKNEAEAQWILEAQRHREAMEIEKVTY